MKNAKNYETLTNADLSNLDDFMQTVDTQETIIRKQSGDNHQLESTLFSSE